MEVNDNLYRKIAIANLKSIAATQPMRLDVVANADRPDVFCPELEFLGAVKPDPRDLESLGMERVPFHGAVKSGYQTSSRSCTHKVVGEKALRILAEAGIPFPGREELFPDLKKKKFADRFARMGEGETKNPLIPSSGP